MWAPFFGRPAYTMTLAARLVQQTGALPLLAWGERLPRGRGYVVHLAPLGEEVMTIASDVRDYAATQSVIAQVVERFGGLDILVNNAAGNFNCPFEKMTPNGWRAVVDIDLNGTFNFCHTAFEALKASPHGGRIINISSGLARFSFPGSSAYGSMKGAVEVLTRYLAKELGSRNIAANVVAPGAIETDFGGGRVRDDKKMNAMVSNLTSLGRVGLPDDIGGVVAFLCSEEAKWINGQRIEVSGGIFL